MYNGCPACGAYRETKIVAGPTQICPTCGAGVPRPRRPLCILSGASGTGKTTACHRLLALGLDTVVLDSDILWGADVAARSEWPRYFNRWLRVCKSITLGGHPVLLAGAGFGVPANLVGCPEVHAFDRVHILALVCDDLTLAQRLRDRPAWRASADPAFVAEHIRYNQWLAAQAALPSAPLTTLDTTDRPPHAVADAVVEWLHCCHQGPQPPAAIAN